MRVCTAVSVTLSLRGPFVYTYALRAACVNPRHERDFHLDDQSAYCLDPLLDGMAKGLKCGIDTHPTGSGSAKKREGDGFSEMRAVICVARHFHIRGKRFKCGGCKGNCERCYVVVCSTERVHPGSAAKFTPHRWQAFAKSTRSQHAQWGWRFAG